MVSMVGIVPTFFFYFSELESDEESRVSKVSVVSMVSIVLTLYFSISLRSGATR